jgi:hypothetical protein
MVVCNQDQNQNLKTKGEAENGQRIYKGSFFLRGNFRHTVYRYGNRAVPIKKGVIDEDF